MTHDEIEWYARHFDHLAALYAAEKGTDDATRWSRAAALIRRLRDERDKARAGWKDAELRLEDMQRPELVRLNGHCDVHIAEARNKALDEAVAAGDKVFGAELRTMRQFRTAILALKTQEPKP